MNIAGILNSSYGKYTKPTDGVLTYSAVGGEVVSLSCEATSPYTIASYYILVNGELVDNPKEAVLVDYIILGLTANSSNQVQVIAIDFYGNQSIGSNIITVVTGDAKPKGQIEYTTPGTYQWVCPAGVTSVCAVTVGGGGGGHQYSTYAGGGCGGALAWKNNIDVIPGQSYTVEVGVGGTRSTYGTSNNATAGGESYFFSISIVRAGGGFAGRRYVSGTSTVRATYTGDGGGYGGYMSNYYNSNTYSCGGGGAGGYTGSGGRAGYGVGSRGYKGYGGAGWGGSNAGSSLSTSGGGGGVGLYGPTPDVDVDSYSTPGDVTRAAPGGSGGEDGYIVTDSPDTKGRYGGGGAGSSISGDKCSNGAGGAVRIIWGEGRFFPSKNVHDV